MSSEFLSQDEVDSLLNGVGGDDEQPAEPGSGPRSYDLAKQERVVRGRMPAMEIINERFARDLRTGLFNFMRKSPEISVTPVKTQKYSDFIRNLAVPTNLNIVSLRPLRGNALFVFEPTLVFTVVDNMFGGDSRFHNRIEGRDFTATEQRIILRMFEVVQECYRTAWQPVHAVPFDYVRSEMHPQFASVAAPSDIVISTTFSIELGAGGGDIHICIPYSGIEPIRDVLHSPTQANNTATDKRWMRMLTQQVQLADVDLVAELAHAEVTVRQILNMKAGDIIDLDLKPVLTAAIDGVPVVNCRYGVLNGKYAIKVDQVLNGTPPELFESHAAQTGESHVH